MKELYIQKIATNHYTFDHGNDSASGHFELSMRKTTMGWTIEVTDLLRGEPETTFLWVTENAREAVKDCLRGLRYCERHYRHRNRY